jgi:hypothetical protein
MRVFVTAALLCLVVSCAYVGEPLAPALNIPRPVTTLIAEQAGQQVLVRFQLPAQTTESLPLEIRGIEVRAEWPGGGQMLTATRGEQGGVTAAAPAKPWVGQAVGLKARTQSRQGKWSDWSAVSVIQVEESVATPAGVKAEATPDGVRVSWRQTAAGVAMRVERRTGDAKAFREAAAIPTAESFWIDTQALFGEQQHYRLTAVSASGLARSEPVEVSALPIDRFAPAVPSGLTAAAGLGSIELSWERPPEPDLAGFAIYRAEGSPGEFVKLNAELTQAANFSDRTVKSGLVYRYAVSSVDQKGNESSRSRPVEATAPN